MNDLKRIRKLPFLIRELLQTAPLTGVLILFTALLKAGCYLGLIYFLQSFIEILCAKDTFSLLGIAISLIILFFLFSLTSLMLNIFTKLASDALTYKFSTNMAKKNLDSSSIDSKEDLIEEYQRRIEALTRDITLVVLGLQALCNTLAIGFYLFYLFPLAVCILFSGVLLNMVPTKSKSSTTKEQPRKTERVNKLTALFYSPDSLLEIKLFAAGDFFQQKWYHFEETLFKAEIKANEEDLFFKGQGDILALLTYLVSLVVMGYYFFQDKLTFGSIIAIGISGRLLQKEAIEALRTYFYVFRFLNMPSKHLSES